MWMMMDSSNELKQAADPMIGRKLRPLMPRPSSCCSSTPSCCGCIRNPKILSWNHSISDHHYGVKRPEMQPLVSTRWNPTPEQLQALEEMYRRGIRTPSAEQIQQIAAKLGRFGKIEGKNVFYWFQNHKARERQKKRRQLEQLAGKKQTSGLGRRYFEIEHHNKKVPIASSCSTTSEDSASMHAAAIVPDQCGKDGWPQFHHNTFATVDNDTCWQLDFSSCLPFTTPGPGPSIITHKPTGQENTNPTRNNEPRENHTLQLFPTASDAHASDDVRAPDHTLSVGTKTTPSEFIEFLPIKN